MNFPLQPSTRIFLWSLPRSVSTAFEHSVGTLRGVRTFHEPYSAAYYLGEDRVSPRYRDVDPLPGHRYNDVVAALETRDMQATAFFVKDMIYAIGGDLDRIPEGYTHSILIRDPRKSIPSLHKILNSGDVAHWTTFVPEEFDFEALSKLRARLVESGQSCAIVDADDLLTHPSAIMQAYCRSVGLPYDPAMLAWDASDSEDRWSVWGMDWYETLTGSTGFIAPSSNNVPDIDALPAEIGNAIDAALPVYKSLHAERLTGA